MFSRWRDLDFPVKLTDRTLAADGVTYLYSWTAQYVHPTTGALRDSNPPRKGTSASNPAREINNLALDVSGTPYVRLRLRGDDDGREVYEFDAGASSAVSCRYEVRPGAVCLSASANVSGSVGGSLGGSLGGGGGELLCDGPNAPTAFTALGDGDATFDDPTKGYAADSSYALCVLSSGQSSEGVEYTGFGFGEPADSTIVSVELVANADCAGGLGGDWKFTLLSALGDGDDLFFPCPGSGEGWPAGDPLWGLALTPAVVNDPSFGVRVRFPDAAPGGTAKLDSVALLVCYRTSGITIGGGGGGVGGGITGSAPVTLTLTQEYELIDTRAPCGASRVVERWCVINPSQCCPSDGGASAYSGACGECTDGLPGTLWLLVGPNDVPAAPPSDTFAWSQGGFGVRLFRIADLGSIPPKAFGCANPDTSFDLCSLWTDVPDTGHTGGAYGGISPGIFRWAAGFNGNGLPGDTSRRDWVFALDQGNISNPWLITDAGTSGLASGTNCKGTFDYTVFDSAFSATQERNPSVVGATCPGPVLADWRNVKVARSPVLLGSPVYTISYIKVIRGSF